MIYNPIHNMQASGIKDVLIVTSTEHMGDMVNLLGSGSDFGLRFAYKVQTSLRELQMPLDLQESLQAKRIFLSFSEIMFLRSR